MADLPALRWQRRSWKTFVVTCCFWSGLAGVQRVEKAPGNCLFTLLLRGWYRGEGGADGASELISTSLFPLL